MSTKIVDGSEIRNRMKDALTNDQKLVNSSAAFKGGFSVALHYCCEEFIGEREMSRDYSWELKRALSMGTNNFINSNTNMKRSLYQELPYSTMYDIKISRENKILSEWSRETYEKKWLSDHRTVPVEIFSEWVHSIWMRVDWLSLWLYHSFEDLETDSICTLDIINILDKEVKNNKVADAVFNVFDKLAEEEENIMNWK